MTATLPRILGKPALAIGGWERPYMIRWRLLGGAEWSNVYLHWFHRDDDDRALHDHPWANTSVVLDGRYVEHTPEGRFLREAGSVVTRQATDAHRLEILPGEHAISLFMTGPIIRDWGFHCPHGWRPWKEFVDSRDSGQIGRGCA